MVEEDFAHHFILFAGELIGYAEENHTWADVLLVLDKNLDCTTSEFKDAQFVADLQQGGPGEFRENFTKELDDMYTHYCDCMDLH
jgi:hypothetical protein